MRFPSPSVSIAPTARRFAFIALALVMFAMGGACEDQHVGRPCELGTTPIGGSSGQVATVSSPALECPSHICLLPGAGDPRSQAQINAMTSGTGPLCTASCESSEDCEDGETGNADNAADKRCATASLAPGRRRSAASCASASASVATSSPSRPAA